MVVTPRPAARAALGLGAALGAYSPTRRLSPATQTNTASHTLIA
jgi:hypothetical protein